MRGLVALDGRYEGVPGWEKLHNQGRLGRAAEVCAAEAGYDEPDCTVDRLGWQLRHHAIATARPLFSHMDERVCASVEHGIKERLHFLRVPFPRVDDRAAPGMVKGPRHRYVPITSPVQADLLSIVRHRLRPAPIKPAPPRGAAQSRLDFEAALRHRPGGPPPPLVL